MLVSDRANAAKENTHFDEHDVFGKKDEAPDIRVIQSILLMQLFRGITLERSHHPHHRTTGPSVLDPLIYNFGGHINMGKIPLIPPKLNNIIILSVHWPGNPVAALTRIEQQITRVRLPRLRCRWRSSTHTETPVNGAVGAQTTRVRVLKGGEVEEPILTHDGEDFV